MTVKTFQQIFDEAVAQGLFRQRTATAREWFRTAAEGTRVTPTKLMTEGKDRMTARITGNDIGSMFLFQYDAKTKAQLPYWDKYPLIFPIEMYDDGFLGINMHYLGLRIRAKLMDALYSAVNNQKWDDTTKLTISYRILASAARYRYFRPTIKRYLNKQVRSKFMLIKPLEWDQALFLPIQRFQKDSDANVWADSAAAITRRGRK